MNLGHFIYSRRWLVIMGLFVVLATLGVISFYYLNNNTLSNDKAANGDHAEHSDHSHDGEHGSNGQNGSDAKQVPSSAIVRQDTTWVSENKSGVTYPPGTQEANVVDAINLIGRALADRDSHKLYDLLSVELRDLFTADSVEAAMGEAVGMKLQPNGEVSIIGNQAEQRVEGVSEAGETQNFNVVLRLENGEWKLYGTTVVD